MPLTKAGTSPLRCWSRVPVRCNRPTAVPEATSSDSSAASRRSVTDTAWTAPPFAAEEMNDSVGRAATAPTTPTDGAHQGLVGRRPPDPRHEPAEDRRQFRSTWCRNAMATALRTGPTCSLPETDQLTAPRERATLITCGSAREDAREGRTFPSDRLTGIEWARVAARVGPAAGAHRHRPHPSRTSGIRRRRHCRRAHTHRRMARRRDPMAPEHQTMTSTIHRS
jgi:hypothetical protein